MSDPLKTFSWFLAIKELSWYNSFWTISLHLPGLMPTETHKRMSRKVYSRNTDSEDLHGIHLMSDLYWKDIQYQKCSQKVMGGARNIDVLSCANWHCWGYLETDWATARSVSKVFREGSCGWPWGVTFGFSRVRCRTAMVQHKNLVGSFQFYVWFSFTGGFEATNIFLELKDTTAHRESLGEGSKHTLLPQDFLAVN